MSIKTATNIADAFVFADANGNFFPDPGEATGTTDATGHFTLTGGSGTLVLSGGTDLLTGLPTVGILDAPIGSAVVSRLTTILDVVAEVNHVSTAVANAEIVAALGFAAGTDLTTLDSEAGAASGDANATKVFTYESDATSSADLIAAAGGSVATPAAETDATVFFTATNRNDVPSTAQLAIASGVGTAAANVIDAIVSNANNLTYLATASGATPSQTVASIAAVAKVVRGAAATSLAVAGTDPTALAAVQSAYTGNNLVILADAAGGAFTPYGPPPSGNVEVAGAAVFDDANGNFYYDPGEAITTSDAGGNFTLSGGSGPIIVAGGTDILTGLPLKGILYAPAGSTVVSRLTTILEVVAAVNDVSPSVANAEIIAALGLAPGTDLTTLNAQAGAVAGDASATKALAYETSSTNTVTLVTAAGGSVSTPAAFADTASNYSSSTAFQGLGVASLTKFALDSGVGGAAAAVIGQVSAAAIALTTAAATSGAFPAEVVSSIAAVAKVIQGPAAAALAAAGSNATSLAAVLAAYTGNNLAILANGAGGTFLLAPTLAVGATASSPVEGVASPGATVALFDGLVQIGAVVADAVNGAFSFTGLALGPGEQTLTARVTNAAGLFSLSSAPLLIVVGTSATIVGELDTLEEESALAAIDLTDTNVLHVASVAALQALVAHDAHALAAIQGGYSFSVTTSASGANPAVSSAYDAAGQLVSSTSDFYTHGALTRAVTTEPDGSSETLIYTANVLTRVVVVHADRSQDTYIYDITGQSYTSEHDQYNPAGTIALAERDYANGSIDSIYKAASDGSSSFDVYDKNGDPTYQGFSYVDGSSSFQTYDSQHNLLEQSTTPVDQMRAVDKFTATGQIYEHDAYAANGQLSLVALTGSDGSHTTFDYSGGKTLTATSPIRNSFVETGAGADTFVFNSSFGNDAITGFHAGNGANHDVLQFNTAGIPNFQALSSLISSLDNGADTVIKLDANNSVFLHNVTVASLKPADCSFSHSA